MSRHLCSDGGRWRTGIDYDRSAIQNLQHWVRLAAPTVHAVRGVTANEVKMTYTYEVRSANAENVSMSDQELTRKFSDVTDKTGTTTIRSRFARWSTLDAVHRLRCHTSSTSSAMVMKHSYSDKTGQLDEESELANKNMTHKHTPAHA